VVGKLIGVAIGTFIAGYGVRTSVQAGMSLGQIGEFSFIIAGVGLSIGVIRPFLYPVAVAVSALTTLLTPGLIKTSGRFASFIDGRMPHRLQTYASLYGAWVNGLRATSEHRTAWARIRRLVLLAVVDVTLLAAIVISISLAKRKLLDIMGGVAHLGPSVARVLLVGATITLIVPFLLGAIRIARALGVALAAEALPAPAGGTRELDLAAAPRRALLVTLQIAILLVGGIPVVALTQPFLPGFPVMGMLLVGVGLLVIPLWRSATNLEGHVRAGAQVILEALAAQSATSAPAATTAAAPSPSALLPGLGNATTVAITGGSAAVGRTLKQINLRGLTGATVIAIDREAADVIYPTGDEELRAGDALIVTGTAEAVQAAQELVAAPPS
jgi:CPA2 family monovalent cation:H+ antiporter-2